MRIKRMIKEALDRLRSNNLVCVNSGASRLGCQSVLIRIHTNPSLSLLFSLGTRIIYELDHMMRLKHSPFSQTPPNLPFIPGVTKPTEFNKGTPLLINDLNNNKPAKPKIVEGTCSSPQTLSYLIVRFANLNGCSLFLNPSRTLGNRL